jgi:hypothetical protein
VLHVQSKLGASKPAMQRLHDVWQNFGSFSVLSERLRVVRRFSAALGRILQAQNDRLGCGRLPESHWRMFAFRANPTAKSKNRGRNARHRD